MEAIYSIIQDLNFPGIVIIGLLLFAIGFWLGNVKTRKAVRKIHEMEKEIMDLNSELLYNDRPGSSMMKTSSHS
jgi:hypothetical protein